MLYGLIPRNVVSFNADSGIPDLSGKVILVTGGTQASIVFALLCHQC